MGEYFVREWCDAEVGNVFGCYVTIGAPGQAQITQYGKVDAAYLGTDLTGDSFPDVVVFSTPLISLLWGNIYIFNLGPTAVNVLSSAPVACGGEFKDIDGDGRHEYITCDREAARGQCAGIATAGAAVKVILEYDEEWAQYVPASYKFEEWYADELIRTEAMAAAATPNGQGEFDNTTKCQVLPLVLSYLYTGDEAAAWEALHQYYHYPDLADFQAHIKQAVEASPFYARSPLAAP